MIVLEKFVKKLVGNTDIEDALDRLDRLTQEEARMAAAQGLKATHDVDNRVQGVGDHVQRVDDRVQDVDNKVQQVADDVGYQKRSSSNGLTSLVMQTYHLSQGTSYGITLGTGSLLLIHL